MTYSVGGTVSGLSGTVVVQFNSGSDVSIASNGAVTLASAVSNGTAYAVTVKTQPSAPAQTCSVTKGTGTVAGANVTDVSIACVTAPMTLSSSTPADGATGVVRNAVAALTFSVPVDAASAAAAVTLTSAAGSQMVTTSVAGPTVSITPASALQPGVEYTLTVATSLHGAFGEPLATAITLTFTTAAAAWSAPELLEQSNENTTHAQIAVDADGNALAVWEQDDGLGHTRVWVNRYSPGAGWGTATLLSPSVASGFSGFFPHVAFDADGNALIVWHQTDAMTYNIWYSRYTRGGGFSAPAPVSSGFNARLAQLAMNDDGAAIAVWQEDHSSRPEIWASRYTPGAGWGVPQGLQSTFGFAAIAPQVAIDHSGNATVVWPQSDGTRFNLWANRYLTGMGWTGAQLIESEDSHSVANPQVVMDASGNAIVVWQQSDGARDNVWANRYASGAWGMAQMIEHDDTGPADVPQVSVDAAGNAHAVWVQYGATLANLVSAEFTPSGGWGTPAPIESQNDGDANQPKIVSAPGGVTYAIWMQNNAAGVSRYDIMANRFTPGSGWGTELVIGSEAPSPGMNAFDPRIAINRSNTVHAVWLRTDLLHFSVWAARLE